MEKILGNQRVFWQAVTRSLFCHSLFPIGAEIILKTPTGRKLSLSIVAICIFSKVSVFHECFGFSTCFCNTGNISLANESVTFILDLTSKEVFGAHIPEIL